MMEDIKKVKEELYNYLDNVQGVGLRGDVIVVYLEKEDPTFPKEYKGYKVVTEVQGRVHFL
jgi:hypothetical protein